MNSGSAGRLLRVERAVSGPGAPSIGGVSPLVALVIGLVLGVLLTAAVLRGRAGARAAPAAAVASPSDAVSRRVLDVMDPAVVVLGADDAVLLANPSARDLGVVRGTRLAVPALVELAHGVRGGGRGRADVRLADEISGEAPRQLGAHAVPLERGPAAPVALVLQDVTEARRVEAVRRDFVANVGHELKTPVGALSLLAEAILGASDDPEAVQRFASRMEHEADRLGRLVRELIDLSRLQGGEPLPELRPVDVDTVLGEAVDRTRMAATAKDIEIAVGGQEGLVVRGVEPQLATAVTNLLANAVAYSPERTKIALAARARTGFAEIAVTDSGIGIPRQDRARIFERFYRVDQSRASSTGGTGLGLAIVKHVASNHGGSVSVWSEEGLGSTFTLRIPLAPQEPGEETTEPAGAEAVDGGRPVAGRGRA
jgi:two-component system, OmpR family, sensor histidine kinase SenX3